MQQYHKLSQERTEISRNPTETLIYRSFLWPEAHLNNIFVPAHVESSLLQFKYVQWCPPSKQFLTTYCRSDMVPDTTGRRGKCRIFISSHVYVSLMWSLSIIGQLHLSGIWQGLQLRTYTRNMYIMKRSDCVFKRETLVYIQ
jgi:hypothetical protein